MAPPATPRGLTRALIQGEGHRPVRDRGPTDGSRRPGPRPAREPDTPFREPGRQDAVRARFHRGSFRLVGAREQLVDPAVRVLDRGGERGGIGDEEEGFETGPERVGEVAVEIAEPEGRARRVVLDA